MLGDIPSKTTERIVAVATCLTAILFLSPTVWSKTLVVEGGLNGKLEFRQDVTFTVARPLEQFSYQIAIPCTYESGGNLQRLEDFRITSTPLPTESKEVVDTFGNHYRKLTWKYLNKDLQATIAYTTTISVNLAPRVSGSQFPIRYLPEAEKMFLKGTKLVQSEAPQIRELSHKLTSGATTEHQAVDAILNFVADAVTYQYNPKQYDALYGYTTGTGNCQNLSHLALALLRASGIPARIVVGQTLKDKWKIPLDEQGSSLVQSMGEGLHTWIEVYYTDLGWLPCDPMQSRLFTSTRHIKLAHGLDASDVKDFWSGTPYVPQMSERITASYIDDALSLKLNRVHEEPRNYQVAVLVSRVKTKPDTQLSEPKHLTLKESAVPKRNNPGTRMELGNRDFPTLMEVYQVVGGIGRKNFERETAEYVTSKTLYAQAFSIDMPLVVEDISLAMHKFGGDGTIYIDLVKDDSGKPSLEGIRSMPVPLERISQKPGYYWVDFTLPEGTKLTKGKYWVVLRHSGEAIMNWFYTPGRRISEPDDTRSTARGWKWEDVLTGEFVYRVRGVVEE